MLGEAAVRAKLIELMDACDATSMDVWMISGVSAGVLDVDVVERVMIEEVSRRSPEVQRYWLDPCNCEGLLN